MTRKIREARWANDRKSQIFCIFEYDDGKKVEAYISDTDQGNPDWKDVIDTVGIETLEKNTKDFLRELSAKRNRDRQLEKERQETAKNEAIFNAKLESFTIDEIKNSKNTKMKSKIRRAKSMMEVHAFTSVLLMLEMLEAEKPKDEQTEEVTVNE